MAQKQTSKSNSTEDETVVEPKKIDTESLDADIDGILDEIDSVLEENAQEFVDSFIQKGGE